MQRKPRMLVIDDGLEYARIVETRMPEVELVRPTPDAPARLQDGPAALSFLHEHAGEIDVVLLDVRFDVDDDRLLPLGPGVSPRRTRRFQGVAILRELRRRHPTLPVVLATAVEDLSLVDLGDVDGELAGQSMTYFLDSDDLDTLRIRINQALQASRQGVEEAGVLWGADRTMQALRRRLEVLARGGMPIILEGETGTGKSYLAERFVHRNSGRSGPFVVLDLATVPGELVSAHLFGAVRGAFTGAVADRRGVFEEAHGGTLFIDEIQNVPLSVQKQLLLVLQDKRVRPLGSTRQIDVDVKVVAGSNQPLDRAVAEGRFRQDLYMRLGPATRVRIPPLRERRGDLEFFARRFVERAAGDADNADLRNQVALAAGLDPDAPLTLHIGRRRRPANDDNDEHGNDSSLELALPAPAWKQLDAHPWPGNVRELSMLIHNLVTFTLVGAVDALRSGSPLASRRLQVDTGLVGELLEASAPPPRVAEADHDGSVFQIRVQPASSLNAVTTAVERQYYRALFQRTRGDFARMALALLGDADKGRAVRLRFNQIGLKVRELRG